MLSEAPGSPALPGYTPGVPRRDDEWSWGWFAVGIVLGIAAFHLVRFLWRTRLIVPLTALSLWFPVLLGHGPNRLPAIVLLGTVFWMSVGWWGLRTYRWLVADRYVG